MSKPDLSYPLRLAEVCLHLSYSDESMDGDVSTALSQAHKELNRLHAAVNDAYERAAKERMTFCEASPGIDEEIEAWLHGFDAAVSAMKPTND